MNHSLPDYRLPIGTRIGHVHLKVAQLDRAINFYSDLLGFHITQRIGQQVAFLSSGTYHHHIALNTWHSKNADPAPFKSAGLYHFAILYPERKDLAQILLRLMEAEYPLTGASDHGVSEAIYLNDPDGNGVELYWDKPQHLWPKNDQGSLEMYTRPLDIEDLFSLLED